MAEWHARAPVRFCDLGGWTDTRIVPHGRVLNFAARIYTYVSITTTVGSGRITLENLDTDERCVFPDIRRMEYNGILDLLKAALERSEQALPPEQRFLAGTDAVIRVRSDAPSASGLGTSAALGVAAVGALSAHQKRFLLPHDIAREAQLLEVENLKLECGVQDQFSAAYGGINLLEVQYPHTRVCPIPIRRSIRCELEDRLVLVYTGKSHFSSAMHQKVIAEASQHRLVFQQLESAAVAGKEALLCGDLEAFADAMNQNWAAQKALHPDITTPEIDALHEAVMRAGGVGFKVNGAGGGGTATILARQNQYSRVSRTATKLGMSVLPSLIDTVGLQIWCVDNSCSVETDHVAY